MKVLKIIGVLILILVVLIVGAISYVKLFLPNTGPATVVKIEATPERIERGKYLAEHVTLCIDCHTQRDWSIFGGPLQASKRGAGGEDFGPDFGFPGHFYSKNISPSHLGSWSDGEIIRAVTTGMNKDGKALFPIMGYKRYGKMDQEDIYSIVAYIRTLESIESTVPESKPEFPVNILINTMPEKAAFSKRPSESDKLNHGKYLVNAAGCIECHSRREKGEIVPGSEFGGGMEFKFASAIARSANITPDNQTGIGNWTLETFRDRFKVYTDSNYVGRKLNPGEPNTPMPWIMYAGMKPSDLEAIYTYLHQLKPISNKVEHFAKQ